MIDRYTKVALEASIVEVQKLMYFLQEAGEPLKLRYQKGLYGPYADNLRHVLIRLEGHHLQGFGDGGLAVKDAEPIVVLPDAAEEARSRIDELESDCLALRIDRTIQLAEGFESAYGMELLASVHWCATRQDGVVDAASAARCVQGWNLRKGRLFTDRQVQVAWDHLRAGGWLTADVEATALSGS